MPKYIITLPDTFDWTDPCLRCPFGDCELTINICPLANAKKAVEIINSLSRALQTHDGVKIYAVEE